MPKVDGEYILPYPSTKALFVGNGGATGGKNVQAFPPSPSTKALFGAGVLLAVDGNNIKIWGIYSIGAWSELPEPVHSLWDWPFFGND